MDFLDFHCDTIGECFLQNKSLISNDLHISLEKARCFSAYGQVFAIWIPDEQRGANALAYYTAIYHNFCRILSENTSSIALCRDGWEVQAAFSNHKTAAILAVEGGAVLGGSLENLEKLYADGVRLMTLTWNGTNELGNGCFAEDTAGLTDFGKQVIDTMEKKHMLVDVSHLNERGFFDVAERLTGPFLASHSNAKIVEHFAAQARNLTDAQIKQLVAHKGLIGLNLCADFLGDNGDTGMDAVLRHILHFLELGAEDCLAFGCDFDGCTVHPTLNGIEQMPQLFDYLLKKHISEDVLNKIFFQNGLAFLIANL